MSHICSIQVWFLYIKDPTRLEYKHLPLTWEFSWLETHCTIGLKFSEGEESHHPHASVPNKAVPRSVSKVCAKILQRNICKVFATKLQTSNGEPHCFKGLDLNSVSQNGSMHKLFCDDPLTQLPSLHLYSFWCTFPQVELSEVFCSGSFSDRQAEISHPALIVFCSCLV